MSELLKRQAEEIRDEVQKGANTAERVGGVLVEIVKEQDKLWSKLEEFIGFTYIESVEIPADGSEVKVGLKTMAKNWETE